MKNTKISHYIKSPQNTYTYWYILKQIYWVSFFLLYDKYLYSCCYLSSTYNRDSSQLNSLKVHKLMVRFFNLFRINSEYIHFQFFLYLLTSLPNTLMLHVVWNYTYFQTWWSWQQMFQHCLVLLQGWPFLQHSFVLCWSYSAGHVTPDLGIMLMQTLHLPSSSLARQVSAAFWIRMRMSVLFCWFMNIFRAKRILFCSVGG